MIQVQDNLAFIDDLTQELMVSMIHQMGENGIDVSEKSFIRDMALIIEMIKSTLYRDMGYKHPLQAFTQTFVDLVIEPDNTPIGVLSGSIVTSTKVFVKACNGCL